MTSFVTIMAIILGSLEQRLSKIKISICERGSHKGGSPLVLYFVKWSSQAERRLVSCKS